MKSSLLGMTRSLFPITIIPSADCSKEKLLSVLPVIGTFVMSKFLQPFLYSTTDPFHGFIPTEIVHNHRNRNSPRSHTFHYSYPKAIISYHIIRCLTMSLSFKPIPPLLSLARTSDSCHLMELCVTSLFILPFPYENARQKMTTNAVLK